MVTKTHKYIAYIFYDEETIDKVTAQNRYIPLTDKVNLDEIVINTKLLISEVNVLLSGLELEGFIIKLDNNRYKVNDNE